MVFIKRWIGKDVEETRGNTIYKGCVLPVTGHEDPEGE